MKLLRIWNIIIWSHSKDTLETYYKILKKAWSYCCTCLLFSTWIAPLCVKQNNSSTWTSGFGWKLRNFKYFSRFSHPDALWETRIVRHDSKWNSDCLCKIVKYWFSILNWYLLPCRVESVPKGVTQLWFIITSQWYTAVLAYSSVKVASKTMMLLLNVKILIFRIRYAVSLVVLSKRYARKKSSPFKTKRIRK